MKLFKFLTVAVFATDDTQMSTKCTDNTELFTVECKADSATMIVTVDETCRQSEFRNVL